MNEAEKFGQLLRATRKARKLGLAQVAEKVDIGVKHLGRIERGEKQPSFELIVDLANEMNVSPALLFDFESFQMDEKALRTQLRGLLEKRDAKELLKAKRVLKIILEP